MKVLFGLVITLWSFASLAGDFGLCRFWALQDDDINHTQYSKFNDNFILNDQIGSPQVLNIVNEKLQLTFVVQENSDITLSINDGNSNSVKSVIIETSVTGSAGYIFPLKDNSKRSLWVACYKN